jgi:hypothetical protein
MDIIEIIAVGMITLTGVVVGAALNNWFSEKGWRKERQDLAKDSLLNALNDFYLDLTQVHRRILSFKEVSTIVEGGVKIKLLTDEENRLTKSGRDLFKAYSVLRRYTKSPIFSLDELDKERNKFEELISKTYENYDKLRVINGNLNKELDDQIKKIYEVIGRVRSTFINA